MPGRRAGGLRAKLCHTFLVRIGFSKWRDSIADCYLQRFSRQLLFIDVFKLQRSTTLIKFVADFGLSNFVSSSSSSSSNHNNNDSSGGGGGGSGRETSRMPNELCVTQCGSPAYAAPELLNNNKYGSKVDIWSM